MKPRLLTMLAVFGILASGCDEKKAKTVSGSSAAGPTADAEVQAVFALESKQDQAECRTVLQQLDNLPSVATRPTLSATDLEEIRHSLQLTPSESAEVGQANFSQTDAAYLEECLLLRAGVRSLRCDGRPSLEQAQAVFDWVCRLIYVDDRVAWPSPPWMTLQSGFGIAHSRAYVILAAWQQLGLDACLIGPSGLKAIPSYDVKSLRPDGKPTYAPLRACGVKIEKDVYLFDPLTGKAFATPDGKGVLTLTQARANPELLRSPTLDEAKDWQIFLSPSMSALSARMAWLQGLNPGNSGVKLYQDIRKIRSTMIADLPGIPCEGWNPPSDSYTPTRILALYSTEGESDRAKASHRDLHRIRMIPLEHMPRTNLAGAPLEYLLQMFATPFSSLYFTADSPRDLMLRGQYQQATSTLDKTKQLVENARTRLEQDRDVLKDFDAWSESFRKLFYDVNRVRDGNPGAAASANKALEDFRLQPRNRDIERAFILGNAAKPLSASIAYLMAAIIHERAERTQHDTPAQALAQWKNAQEWWGRFLDASALENSVLPAREAHARELLKRCRQFTSK